MEGNGDIDINKLKNNLGKIGATVNGETFSLDVTLNGFNYTINEDGDVEKAKSKIIVDENSLTITNTDGSSIIKGQVEQGTALKISFNASVQNGTVTISPSLPHVTTAEEIESKAVTFTITASVPDETVEPLEYTVNLKDVYKSNVVSMEELKANASTYFGYDVINYAETLPTELQDTKWQLFYAGALDGETEERIYLISKEYVKNTVLPAKNGARPIPADGSDYNAKFSNYKSNDDNINDGVCQSSIYSGSSAVVTNMKKYNKSYFITNNYSSTKSNIRAVAYMLDTTTWNSFANSTKDYAEWAIGGPTVELLFTAYNKYKGKTGSNAYVAEATSGAGYKVSDNGGSSFTDLLWDNAIENDTASVDNPYSVSTLTSQTGSYWIASPSDNDSRAFRVIYVKSNGRVGTSNSGNDTYSTPRRIPSFSVTKI